MRMRFVRRGGAIGVAVVASLVLGAMPASASPGDGSAYAAKVSVKLLGQLSAVNVGPLAESKTSGPTTASLATVSVPGVVSAGVVTSTATLDEATGVVHAQADVANVGISLGGLGTIGAVQAVCDATQAGNTGSATLADVKLLGVSVPVKPAPNTEINVVGIAKIVFNEQITNGDGSLTVNAVHVFANALVATGDIILAQARCGPAVPPVPLASGVGLWLGLGLLAMAAIPAGFVIVRKRRTA